MRWTKVWAHLLGIAGATVESVEFEGEDLVVRVRLDRRRRLRCGICGKPAKSFDQGGGERRWRALDLGSTRCFLKAQAPRERCQKHGVVVAWVPWADHGARSTRGFDDQVAWLAVYCNRSTVSELMRISWRTVGWIVARVSRRLGQGRDQLAGLRRIGIAEGRDEDALDRFFFELGDERAKLITHVSADASSWIANVVTIRCPNAVRCTKRPEHADQYWGIFPISRFRSATRPRLTQTRYAPPTLPDPHASDGIVPFPALKAAPLALQTAQPSRRLPGSRPKLLTPSANRFAVNVPRLPQMQVSSQVGSTEVE